MSKSKKLIKEENGIRYFENGNWVDLSELMLAKNNHNGIDWGNSIKRKIKFLYGNQKYTVELIKFKEPHFCYINYNDFVYKICTQSIRTCRFGTFIEKYNKLIGNCYKYNINEIVNNMVVIKRFLKQTTIGRTRIRPCYVLKCLVDGCETERLEENIQKGDGCPVCSGKRVVKEINSIWKLRPDLVKYFKNPIDAETHALHSNKKVWFKCPCCETEKEMIIDSFIANGFSCPKCSDGVSYPNKFMFNVLDNLKIDFEPEKSFKWCGRKHYDFYISSLNCIIECHGGQHYKAGFSTFLNGARTLKEEQSNDKLKELLARRNGIKNYIIIDCSKSNIEYIKASILNSELPELLNFKENDIDWKSIDKTCVSSLLVEACNLWNDGLNDILEISKLIKKSYGATQKYLRKGMDLGICSYNPSENLRETHKHVEILQKGRKKKISQITYNKIVYMYDNETKKFVGRYFSSQELERLSEKLFGKKIYSSLINKVCNGSRKSTGGYYFSYNPLNPEDEFTKIIYDKNNYL